MPILYANLLGGITIVPNVSPVEQVVTSELADLLRTFNEVTLPVLLLFILFMVIVMVGYVLRGLFGRDKRQDELLKLSLSAGQTIGATVAEALKGIKEDTTEAIREVKEDAATMMLAANTALKNNTDALNKISDVQAQNSAVMTSLIKSNEAVTASLGRHTSVSEQNQIILNGIVTILEDVKRRLNHLETAVLEFPKLSEFKTEFDELRAGIERAAQKCQEAKRQTDEHAIIPANVKSLKDKKAAPETGEGLTPGAGHEELPKAS